MADGDKQLPIDGDKGGDPAPITSVSFDDLKTTVGDAYFTDKGFDADGLKAHLTELTTLKTTAAERAAGVPQDGKYDFGLSKEFKLPDGANLPADYLKTWNVSPAKAERFAAYAKAKGMSQAEVTEFVSDWANADIADKLSAGQSAADQQKAEEDAIKADAIKVLGENYGTVIETNRSAWQAFLVEHLGKDAGEQLAKDTGFQSAANIKQLGDLMNALRTKMATNPPGGGKERPDANTLTGAQMHRQAILESVKR